MWQRGSVGSSDPSGKPPHQDVTVCPLQVPGLAGPEGLWIPCSLGMENSSGDPWGAPGADLQQQEVGGHCWGHPGITFTQEGPAPNPGDPVCPRIPGRCDPGVHQSSLEPNT